MCTILLLDIDCFFASVEMALNPALRGKPLCVGGTRGTRGIVACPNYEARAYGVKTAMPLRTAERLLPPWAVFMPGHHRLYGEYSERVMNILSTFTPDLEQVSVDEAYLDVTGCMHLWQHDPFRLAGAIKERITQECGLNVSIGVASNKVCAKIAASLKKPNGLVIVPPGTERQFLAPLPVEMIPGVGVRTAPKLHALGIYTVADITPTSLPPSHSFLVRYLRDIANGDGDRVVRHDRVEKSISRDTTFAHDTNNADHIVSTLYYLTERCCKTLRTRHMVARTVTAKVRFADFTTVQKQTSLTVPTANEEDVFGVARQMVNSLMPRGRMVRLVGVKASGLRDSDGQITLDVVPAGKLQRLHQRLDSLQLKHGYAAIRWGITQSLHDIYAMDREGYHLHSPVYEL